MVTENILARYPGCRISGFPKVKFLSPLSPDIEFLLTWEERPDGDIDFYCDTENLRLVQGRIRLDKTR